MAKLSIKAGATSQSINIFVQNNNVTTGAGLTGLVFSSTGLTAYYTFSGTATGSTVVTLVTLAAVNSAYSSGGFKEIDSTNMPGWYRFDIPNAALASGNGRSVGVHLQGATNMAPVVLEIELTGTDNQDAVRMGMTALPNAAAGAASGVFVNGTNAGALTESYSALNAAPTLNQILYEIRALLAQTSITGTTLTATKVDGVTTAETFTLNSSTAPTSITRAS